MATNWYDDLPNSELTGVVDAQPEKKEEAPASRILPSIQPLPEASTMLGEVYKGASAGGRGLRATGAGLVALAADAVGDEDIKRWGLDTYKEQEEINAERNAPAIASYKDIHNFSDFGKYAAYGLSKGLTETAPLIAMGGIGGGVASKLADGAIKEAVDFGVAQGLSQEVAEKAVATAVMHGGKDIAEGAFKEGLASSFAEGSAARAFGATAGEAGSEAAAQAFGEEAADMFGQKATKAAADRATAGFVGSQAGNAAAITAQSIADTYGQTGDAKTALEYGGASGALNSLAFGIVAAPAFRKMIGLESSAAKGAFFKHLAAKTATDTALMSGVAYPSTYLSQEAQAQVDPNFDINSDAASQQRKEAMFGGAVMGAGFGLGFGGIEAIGKSHAPLTAQALRQISVTKPGDGGVPDGGKAVPDDTQENLQLGWSPPGDKESSDWSRPTYITENGVSIRAQKDLSLNRWVIPDPDSLPDSLKVTGLRSGLNGNVIIDPSMGSHAAALSFKLDMALDKLNNPPQAPEPLDLKFPNAAKIEPNDRLSQDTDTTGWAPPIINGGELANKSAEESAANLLEAQQMEELQRQSPEEYELLKQRLAEQQKVVTEPNEVQEGKSDGSQLTFSFNDQKSTNPDSSVETTPEDVSGAGESSNLRAELAPIDDQIKQLTSDLDSARKDYDQLQDNTPGKARANRYIYDLQEKLDELNATRNQKISPVQFSEGVQSGDVVSFDHPDIGQIHATIEEGPKANQDGDKISDTIRLSYIDPKTEDRFSVSVPRHSWGRIAPEKRTPDINAVISDKIGSNPTPESLQQLGFTDILVSPDSKKPGAVMNNVIWDEIGEKPTHGDPKMLGGRISDEVLARRAMKLAYGSGDYSEVTKLNFLPFRVVRSEAQANTDDPSKPKIAVHSYGIFTGALAETKADIQKAKEITLRQWSLGMPVLAKAGDTIPDGFHAVKLKNGLQKITRVSDYMDRSWRRDNTPESFRVDQSLESKGSRKVKNGVGLFREFYKADNSRLTRSEAQLKANAEKPEEDKIRSSTLENLSPLENDVLNPALRQANDFIENSKYSVDVKTRALDIATDKLIRSLVPATKTKGGKERVRVTRPSFVGRRTTAEQNRSNIRVQTIFLNAVKELQQLKKQGVTPDLKDRIDKADAKKKSATQDRSAKENRFDPVRDSVTGTEASKIARSAYRSSEAAITDKEYRNIVQDILATNPEFSKADKDHLENVKAYHKSTQGTLSVDKVNQTAIQALQEAYKKQPIADVAFRGPENTISINDQRLGSKGENEASLSSKDTTKPTLGEMRRTMTHGSDDTTEITPKGLQVESSNDNGSPADTAEILRYKFDSLPTDLRNKILKIGMLGQKSRTEAEKVKEASRLSSSSPQSIEKTAKQREEKALRQAIVYITEHLENKAGVKIGGKLVEDPLSRTNAITARKAISYLNDMVADGERDKLRAETGPEYADRLIRESEERKKAYTDRLLRESESRKLEAQREASLKAATRKEIKEALKQTRKELKTNASAPKDKSGRNDQRGDRTSRGGVSDENPSLGGLESTSSRNGEEDQNSGYLGVRGSTGERPGNVQESPGSSTRGGSGVGAPAFETRALGEGARRLIVESAGNLTKEESAKLTPSEVDAAHEALNTTADVKAAHKSEVITGATPRIEDIASKSLKEILQGVADEQRAYLENKIRVDQIRNNHGDLLRAGGFHSPLEFLKRVASGKTGADQDMVTRAKAMLALQDRFDWNKISTQVGSFRDGENRASWAGYASKEKGGRNIYLNLDANHRRGSIVNTYLHELTHSIAAEKLDSFLSGKGMKLSQVEIDAASRLKAMHEESLRRAASKGGMAGAKTATLDKLQAWAKEKVQKGSSKYAMFTNLHEFVQELQDSPEAHELLVNLGYGTANKEEAKFSFSMGNILKEAFNAITQLITGRKIDTNSPLAKAFADSWDFTFNGTIKQSKETPLHGKLADFKARESWIKDQLEQRDLAGTTDDRKALSAEWDKTKGQEAPVVEEAKAPLGRRQVTPASEVPRLRISDVYGNAPGGVPRDIYDLEGVRRPRAEHDEALRKLEEIKNPSRFQAVKNLQEREEWIRNQIKYGATYDRAALLKEWNSYKSEEQRSAEENLKAAEAKLKSAEAEQQEASVAKLTEAQSEKEAALTAEKEAYAQRVSDAEKARVENDKRDRAEAQVKLKEANDTLAKMEAKGKLVRTKDGGYVPAEGKAGKNALAPLAKALTDIAAAKKILGKDAVVEPVKETEAKVSAQEPVTEVSEPVAQESGESRLETAKNRVKAAEAEIQRLREDGQIKILDSGHDSPQTPEANDAFDEKKQANLELKAAQDEAKKTGKAGKGKAKTNPEPPEDNPPTGGGGGGKRGKSGQGKAEATQATPVASEPPTATTAKDDTTEDFSNFEPADVDKVMSEFPETPLAAAQHAAATMPIDEWAKWVKNDGRLTLPTDDKTYKVMKKVGQNRIKRLLNGTYGGLESAAASDHLEDVEPPLHAIEAGELIRETTAGKLLDEVKSDPKASEFEKYIANFLSKNSLHLIENTPVAIHKGLEYGWMGVYDIDKKNILLSDNYDANTALHEILHSITQSGNFHSNELDRLFSKIRGEVINRGLVTEDQIQNPETLFHYAFTDKDELIAGLLEPSVLKVLNKIPMRDESSGILSNAWELLKHEFLNILGFKVKRGSALDKYFTHVMELATRRSEEGLESTAASEEGLESTAGGNSIFDRVKESAPAEMLGKAKDALVGETIATFNGGTYKKGGLINSAIRGWDIRQQNNWFASRGRINEQESRAAFFIKKLDSAVKGAYPKGSEIPWEQMNTALGNIRNPLTEDNLAEIRDTRAKFGRKAANALEAELRQTNREIFKKDQQAALDALPKEVAGAITQMTDHISALSQTLNKENILTGDLKAIVEANGGIYLNRSYQIFDDPKWKDKVRKIPEIINPVTKLLRDRMIQSETSKVMMESQREGKKISRDEALTLAKDRVTDEMVNGSLERLLSISEDGVDGIGAFGKLPGRKDVSVFDNRGQISKEIQNLWGVHTDPHTNYTRTISKMASLIGDHQFLNETRNMGLKEGWFWNPKDEDNAGDHAPAGYKKFAAEGNKSLAPLDGLYMKKEMSDAMLSMYPKDGDNGTPAWLRYMMKLTGATMMAKTVLSPATQIRNFMGNLVFLASTGNFNVATLKKLGGDARKITNPFNKYDSQEKVQGMVEKLTRLGVIKQSVGGRMIRELMQEKNAKAHDGTNSLFYKYVVDPAQKVSEFAQKSYEYGDDIYKATIWMSEREKYQKAFPKMSEEELDQRAADIARSIHPTYELSPSFTKELQKFPIIAPFIRFTTEIYRTTHNLANLAYSEIKEGNATGNAELAKIGWGRVKGMAAIAIGPSLAIAAQQAMMGTTSEDEEAVRKFLPDWQKNNQLFIWKNGDGKVSYYDYTYLDAYGTPLREPVKAIFRAINNSDNAGEAISNAVIDGVRQAISPFSNEQILSGAIMDIARNKSGASGAPVFNPQDSVDRKAEDIGLHVASAFSPGLIDSVSRIAKGFMGSVSDSGKEYNAAKEIAAPFVGRVSELNVSNALQFKASQFLRNERDAAQLLNHELLSQGTRTNEAVMSGYTRSNEAKMELVKDLRKTYQSAIALGLSPERAAATLSGSHIGKDVIGMVTGNYYTKLEPSKQSIKLVNSRGQGSRVNALEEIMKNTPSKVSFK